MELRDIEYFAVVAKHGNLGRAAEVLGLSQSALSKCLRRLELEMHAKLVRRTPKGVELTAEGSTLVSRAHRLRLSLNDVAREVSDVSKGLAGDLRVGAGAGFALHLLPLACHTLARDAPNVTLKLRDLGQGDSFRSLRNGEIDLAVAATSAFLEEDLSQEFLYDDKYIVCASANHRLAGKKTVTLADVARERWTISGPTFATWRRIHQVFEERGLTTPRVTVETGNPALRLPLVASSDLLGYSWASLVRRAAPHLRVVQLRVRELTLPLRISVAFRNDGYLSPVARRFIEILKTTAKEIVSEKP